MDRQLPDVSGHGDIGVYDGPDGVALIDARPKPILGRITSHGAGNAYGFARIDDSAPTTFPDMTGASENNATAYEIAGSTAVPNGTKVLLYPLRLGTGYVFHYAAAGGGSGTPMPRARVDRITTGFTVAHDTAASVEFNAENFDTDAFHSNATNPSRLTVPSAGLYLIGAHIGWSVNATGTRAIIFLKNGVAVHWGVCHTATAGGTDGTCQSYSWLDVASSAGDYYEVSAYQTSGGNLDVIIGSAFWITKLST